MASIARDGGGRKRILFRTEKRGKRYTISLGKTSIKQAESFKVKVENLIGGRFGGGIDPETARWVGGLEDDVHAKLAAVGLVRARSTATVQQSFTVGEWVRRYIESRPDVKAITRGKWQNAANKLSAFFREQPISEITVQQARSIVYT